MDEDTLIPPSAPESGLPEKKKRGRKPKNQTAESSDSQAAPKIAKKRGRPKKAKVPEEETVGTGAQSEDAPTESVAESGSVETASSNASDNNAATSSGPQWRDVHVEAEDSYSPDNEIFTGTDSGDDFAYSKSSREEASDEEIPQYFSTSDEDLDPDAYRNVPDAEGSSESYTEGNPEPDESEAILSDPSYESFADAEAARQDRRNNRKNWKQNARQDNFRGNYQQNRQQNRQQQNRQQNQQRQNRNIPQQNRQQQNRQQNQQQQRQQQSKPKKNIWKQAENDAEAMNPGNLPEWDTLKTEAGICQWIERLFEGKTAEPAAEESRKILEGAEAATLTLSATESESATPTLSEAAKTTSPEAAPESASASGTGAADTQVGGPAKAEIPPTAPEDMSYWELLASSNDTRVERSEAPEALEGETAKSAEAPAPAEVAAGDNRKTDSGEQSEKFEEQKFFPLPDGSKIDSVEGYEELCPMHIKDLRAKYAELSIPFKGGVPKCEILAEFFRNACEKRKLVYVNGVLDVFEDGAGGAITFASDSYALKCSSVYVPQIFIDKYALKRGHIVGALAAAPRLNEKENCPFAVRITSVMGASPDSARDIIPFTDLVPYYPTRRIILESPLHNSKDNLSMRAVDLLTPIGFGQRALIVAPPRTGKTVLMQSMAKSIRFNNPEAKVIILLVDERPEEVTDFKRAIDAEVIASTFDQEASSHVHAAEMVISKARRMVEVGDDVVILLDSITRLARAYNALMPNGGRTMSGGVEANALQKPKKFFGSARNIEGGGSLTIIGTALIETGSKMDEVIFEEFKGTGNLELDLDRSLSDKRIFPAINIEKSGTRKEELLYHPDELTKIYTLRRAMKGIPAADSMEMLIQRLKKVKTNVEFLLGLNR